MDEAPLLRVAGVGIAGMAGEAGIMPSKTTISSSSLNLEASPVIRTTLYEIRCPRKKAGRPETRRGDGYRSYFSVNGCRLLFGDDHHIRGQQRQ